MTQPHRIRPLAPEVVNRIAAGEVIQRPASALKELLENALDAGATSISVTLRSGGLKSLCVQDNGHGIDVDDFPLLCQRFTTSKLRRFEDLRDCATFGFRGEALASLTHVACVQVTSAVADAACAHRADFVDGVLQPDASGKALPTPCAGTQGTTVLAESMFYNTPLRRQALRNAEAEYRRCLDVVMDYAVHYAGRCAFACRKQGAAKADVNTLAQATRRDTIRDVYGAELARELIDVAWSTSQNPNEPVRGSNDTFRCRLSGLVTNANYSRKKTFQLVLFINNRLVSSTTVKRVLKAVYERYLPRNTHPFVYLHIELPPRHVDVNVHPTKAAVRFLHENMVADRVAEALETALQTTRASRVFFTQSLLVPDSPAPVPKDENDDVASAANIRRVLTSGPKAKAKTPTPLVQALLPGSAALGRTHRVRVDKLIRTDPDDALGALDVYFSPRTATPAGGRKRGAQAANVTAVTDKSSKRRRGGILANDEVMGDLDDPFVETVTSLTSILSLRRGVLDAADEGMAELFQKNTFVGCVLEHSGALTYTLVQCKTELFLVNLEMAVHEFMYQRVLQKFSAFPRWVLTEAAPVAVLLGAAMGENATDEAASLAKRLGERADMLADYFGMELDCGLDGAWRLLALPDLVPGYAPPLYALPSFLLCLARDVTWKEEQACLEGVSRALARFYAWRSDASWYAEAVAREPLVQHTLFPAMRKARFAPSGTFATAGGAVQVASLTSLYKIFERC